MHSSHCILESPNTIFFPQSVWSPHAVKSQGLEFCSPLALLGIYPHSISENQSWSLFLCILRDSWWLLSVWASAPGSWLPPGPFPAVSGFAGWTINRSEPTLFFCSAFKINKKKFFKKEKREPKNLYSTRIKYLMLNSFRKKKDYRKHIFRGTRHYKLILETSSNLYFDPNYSPSTFGCLYTTNHIKSCLVIIILEKPVDSTRPK